MQLRSDLLIFGGQTRNFEDELKGIDNQDQFDAALFFCSLSKFQWTRVACMNTWTFLSFAASCALSETELLLFGGLDRYGKVF